MGGWNRTLDRAPILTFLDFIQMQKFLITYLFGYYLVWYTMDVLALSNDGIIKCISKCNLVLIIG